jgi:serine/threonine-protein kinase
MSNDLPDLQARLGDRYLLERQLGRGGMGAVYLARDRTLDRPVALKVLPAEFASQPDLRDRFLRETRVTAGFSHPNIVPVFSIEDRAGLMAYTMGFVEGESLAERVKRTGPLGARDTVKLLQDVGYALSYAHGRGVVHRDIKPDNIMLERATGRALLMDFGIARSVGAAPAAAGQGITRVGEVVGTPEFMSPEQAAGDVVDGRSDLYSLGLVAFFAVTGRLAITGDNTAQVLARQLTQEVPDVGALRPDLPPALADAIERLVRKGPAARFASAEELEAALDAAQLAAPEVPLPVRLLAQDLAQLGLVAAFFAIIAFLLQRAVLKGGGNIDIALPGIFLFAVLWGRVASALARARRTVEAGYAPVEILAGFGRVLDEQEAERARLRAQPVLVARRRRMVGVFLGTAALAVLLAALVLQSRVQVAPGRFRVSLPGVITIFGATVMLGIAFIGLARSPFRPTPGEKLFGAVWLGPFGRLFLRLAARGVTPAGAPATIASSAVAPAGVAPGPVPASADPSVLVRLESRVAELERWRASGERN